MDAPSGARDTSPPGLRSPGAPVVLFSSLVGTQLECVRSPVDGWTGELVVMNSEALYDGFRRKGQTLRVRDSVRTSVSYHHTSNGFVQHTMLQMDGSDVQMGGGPIEVRARAGLRAVEYLSEDSAWQSAVGVKGMSKLLAGLIDFLKAHGYCEWDGKQGGMLAAGYDWRLMPREMEARDGLMTRVAAQLEAMVAADCEKRPAVVVAHSYGCKVSKWFLHWCHEHRGGDWVRRHIGHWVPLAGPWAGAVKTIRNTVIDGSSGSQLDFMFSTSQLLTISRSWPSMRNLQPTGLWLDGLELPFLYLRRESYLQISLGPVRWDGKGADPGQPPPCDGSELQLRVAHQTALASHSWEFREEHPFVEKITFVVPSSTERVKVKVRMKSLCRGKVNLDFKELRAGLASKEPLTCDECTSQRDDPVRNKRIEVDLCKGRAKGWKIELRVMLTFSSDLDSCSRISDQTHPLGMHSAGEPAERRTFNSCYQKTLGWDPASQLVLQRFIGLYEHAAEAFEVPGPDGTSLDMTSPPPESVERVDAFYGVNVPTPRTLFLKHRSPFNSGGPRKSLLSPFEFDHKGDADGVVSYDGIGWETEDVQQIRPDTGKVMYRSGDGTVPYHSSRLIGRWAQSCQLRIHELNGCEHRQVSEDERMLERLREILGCEEAMQEKSLLERFAYILVLLKSCILFFCCFDISQFFQSKEVWNDHDRGQGCLQRCMDHRWCEVVAKSGWRTMSEHRGKMVGWMWTASLICTLCLVLTLVSYAVHHNVGFLQAVGWYGGDVHFDTTAISHIWQATTDDFISIDWIVIGVHFIMYKGKVEGDTSTCSHAFINCRHPSVGLQSADDYNAVDDLCPIGGASTEPCQACFEASLWVLGFAVLTLVFQIIQVRLAYYRADALTDSRGAKLGAMLVCVITVTLYAVLMDQWTKRCLDSITNPDEFVKIFLPGSYQGGANPNSGAN